jgi:hypothetical protein
MFQHELEIVAYKLSEPFCYGCYTMAVNTKEHGIRCPKCFTDDLMRILPDDGPEWGTDWVVKSLLQTHCDALSDSILEERFMDMLNDCYDKVKIGGHEWDHGEAFKRLDEIAFQQELSAYIDSETDETIVTFDNGSTYYEISEIEQFLEENS